MLYKWKGVSPDCQILSSLQTSCWNWKNPRAVLVAVFIRYALRAIIVATFFQARVVLQMRRLVDEYTLFQKKHPTVCEKIRDWFRYVWKKTAGISAFQRLFLSKIQTRHATDLPKSRNVVFSVRRTSFGISNNRWCATILCQEHSLHTSTITARWNTCKSLQKRHLHHQSIGSRRLSSLSLPLRWHSESRSAHKRFFVLRKPRGTTGQFSYFRWKQTLANRFGVKTIRTGCFTRSRCLLCRQCLRNFYPWKLGTQRRWERVLPLRRIDYYHDLWT